MALVILFVLGIIVGSFLNVVGLRYNSGLSLRGRSSCPHCKKKLNWWELVPIVGFLFLIGRCSQCKTRISWQYPLVEIFTGLVFVTVPLFMLPVFAIYIVIGIYDLRHKIIPDSLSYLAIIISSIIGLINGTFTQGVEAGILLFSFFALIWLFSKGRAMGFGDAKLAVSVGLLLGLVQSVSAIILAFWIGAAYGIVCMLFSGKKITIKSEIPFAPFIILGAWAAVAFHFNILNVTF